MSKRKEIGKMKNIIQKIGCAVLALTTVFTYSGCNQDSGNSDSSGIQVIKTPDSFKGNTGEVALEKGDTYAVIKIKDYGEIKFKLFPEAAPKGVSNFIELANSGYYTDKTIHRVMKNFMMQGGSANGDGMSTSSEPKFNVEYNKNMRHYYGALCYANANGINGSQFYIINNKTAVLTDAKDYKSAIEECDQYIAQGEALVNSTTGDQQSYYQQIVDTYKARRDSMQSSLRAIEERTEEIEQKYGEVGGYPYLDGGYTVFGQAVEGFDVIDKIAEVEVKKQGQEESLPVTTIVIESVTVGTVE